MTAFQMSQRSVPYLSYTKETSAKKIKPFRPADGPSSSRNNSRIKTSVSNKSSFFSNKNKDVEMFNTQRLTPRIAQTPVNLAFPNHDVMSTVSVSVKSVRMAAVKKSSRGKSKSTTTTVG